MLCCIARSPALQVACRFPLALRYAPVALRTERLAYRNRTARSPALAFPLA